MKPKTPLPWTEIPEHNSGDMTGISYEMHDQDFEYILHACNAYPKLHALIEDISVSHSSYAPDAKALLKELGE